MNALTNAVRQATRRAADDDEDEDVKTKGRAEENKGEKAEDDESEPEASEDEEETTASEEDKDEAEDDEEDKPQARAKAPRRSARGYTLAHAVQTVELCAIAGVSARQAHRFVKAQTPVAEVRSALASRSTKESSEPLNTTPAKADGASSWDDVIAKVNARAGVSRR